jgi:hypothetical protein
VIHEKTGTGKTGNAVIDISEAVQDICDKLDLVPSEVAVLAITTGFVHVQYVNGDTQTFAVRA